MAPAWLAPWWCAFGNGRPVVACLHGPFGFSGLLPLYQLDDKLLPMGVGLSDYFDALLAPEAPQDAAAILLAAALAATDACRCDFPELPSRAHVLHLEIPPGWRQESWDGSLCPVLPLLPVPAIPQGKRRDLRQARHRADRAGGWCVERANDTNLSDMLDMLAVLHTARWKERGQPGVFADSRVYAFHRAAAPQMLGSGLLRMESLRLRGRTVAVIYALLASAGIFFYLGGFDCEAAFESPGTILMGHMLEEAAGEGLQEAHFLRGGEPYKYSWGALDHRNRGRSFVRV